MAAHDLTVVSSPQFPQAFDRLVTRLERMVRAAEIRAAERLLTTCYYEDSEGHDCKKLATVHLLGSDYDYCLQHFQEVSRG